MRPSHRKPDELRPITFIRHFTQYAEGSVLASFGKTKVICNASVQEGVPRFLKDSQKGWITSEYGMLPRSTHTRMPREASRGKQGSRTVEIQRLIGRSLRAAVNLNVLNGYTITIDCDVIQADGGTRTVAINGACIALVDALCWLQSHKIIRENPLKHMIAGVSVGIYKNKFILDLDYNEDLAVDTDMNIIMTEHQALIEIQGTAENNPFHSKDLYKLMEIAQKGISSVIALQKKSLKE